MSFVLYLTNNIGPTRVGVNTFSTMVLFTLTTNCDGGTLLTTQHTNFCLILCLILHGGRVAFVKQKSYITLAFSGVPKGAKFKRDYITTRVGISERLATERSFVCYA